MNVRLDRPTDSAAKRFTDLLDSLEMTQHMTRATHTHDGILDVIVTRSDDSPSSLSVTEVGLSDHYLVTWSLNVRRTSVPAYVTSERRLWKNFDTDAFHDTLSKLSLCSRIAATAVDCDAMAEQCNEVITTILDDVVPLTKTTYRVRRSDPWYDDQCRSAKRTARLLERREALQACTEDTSVPSSVSVRHLNNGRTSIRMAHCTEVLLSSH